MITILQIEIRNTLKFLCTKIKAPTELIHRKTSDLMEFICPILCIYTRNPLMNKGLTQEFICPAVRHINHCLELMESSTGMIVIKVHQTYSTKTGP